MSFLQTSLKIFGLAVVFAPVPASVVWAGTSPENLPVAHEISPLALFKDDKLTACGVRATFPGDDGGHFDLLLVKRETDGETEWAVRFSAAPGSEIRSTTVSLKTAEHDTSRLFTPVLAQPAGSLENRGPLDETTGTKLIIGFMIGGGTFTLSGGIDPDRTYPVTGPLPHEARSGYLNCAGDLYRP